MLIVFLSQFVKPSEQDLELVTCSGHGKNGALCVLQMGVRPQVVTTFELPGCRDMWTVLSRQEVLYISVTVRVCPSHSPSLLTPHPSHPLLVYHTLNHMSHTTHPSLVYHALDHMSHTTHPSLVYQALNHMSHTLTPHSYTMHSI